MMVSIGKHPFVPDDTAPMWDGEPMCGSCPLPKGHEIHTLPAQTQERSEHEARWLGEGER